MFVYLGRSSLIPRIHWGRKKSRNPVRKLQLSSQVMMTKSYLRGLSQVHLYSRLKEEIAAGEPKETW